MFDEEKAAEFLAAHMVARQQAAKILPSEYVVPSAEHWRKARGALKNHQTPGGEIRALMRQGLDKQLCTVLSDVITNKYKMHWTCPADILHGAAPQHLSAICRWAEKWTDEWR